MLASGKLFSLPLSLSACCVDRARATPFIGRARFSAFSLSQREPEHTRRLLLYLELSLAHPLFHKPVRDCATRRGVGVIPVDERRASIAHLSSSDAMVS
eukprot:3117340-Pleurochrysis_carterae.AAC.1